MDHSAHSCEFHLSCFHSTTRLAASICPIFLFPFLPCCCFHSKLHTKAALFLNWFQQLYCLTQPASTYCCNTCLHRVVHVFCQTALICHKAVPHLRAHLTDVWAVVPPTCCFHSTHLSCFHSTPSLAASICPILLFPFFHLAVPTPNCTQKLPCSLTGSNHTV